MSTQFQPPPTYAEVVLVGADNKGKFNPIWLKWFLDLAGFLSAAGGGGGTVVHNNTTSKQGGGGTEFYHLTAAEYALLPGAALSKTDDTNVTLTLGGAATTALLRAASLTLGWTGTLAVARGGTGVGALGALTKVDDTNVTLTLGGTPATALVNAASITAGWTGTLAVARGGTGVGALGALTKADDTNVTLTLGGAPATALVNAASITAGWTGQLGLTRGGTAASLAASNGGIVYSGAAAFAVLSGTATAGQILRSGASAAPAWSTPTFPNTATTNKALIGDGTNIVLSTPTIPLTSAPGAGKVMIGDGTNWVASTPTYPNAAPAAGKTIRGDGTNFLASTFTIPDTYAQGDLLYASAANVLSALAKSTAGFKLFMNAAGTLPEWALGVKMITSTINTANATASVGYTGVGFKPSSILAMAIINVSTEVSFGMADASTQRVLFNDDADTAKAWAYDTSLLFLRQSTADYYYGTLSSFDTDGFTIAWTKTGTTAGTALIFFLCFR